MPVPSSIGGRLSPISPLWSPMVSELPLPSRPSSPLPQHLTSPVESSTHVCAPPAETAMALMPVPSSIGRRLSPMLDSPPT